MDITRVFGTWIWGSSPYETAILREVIMKLIKIMLTINILFFSSSSFSKEGDFYFCESKVFTVVSEEGNEEYNNQKFKFLRKKDVIEFGKGGYFDNYSLNLTIQIDEMFIAVSDYENLQYADGELYYTGPSYVDKSIINIIANCDIF